MSRIIVINHVTLDGVVQAPGHPDEDTRDGFAHGGWATGRSNDEAGAAMGTWLDGEHAFLFGHRSYDGMLSAWNRMGGPYKDALNATTKYVASRDPATTLDWPNSVLLHGDVPAEVADLKQRATGNLVMMGSGRLIRSLMEAGLVDVFLLMIHPIVLGQGHRLFDGGAHASLQLTHSAATSTGVLLATFEPDHVRRP